MTENSLFQNSEHIGCYLATEEEFDCEPIIQAIWKAKKNCYLPVIAPHDEYFMDFALYQPGASLHLNRYHILEPENKNIIQPEELDLVIVPLVGFDLQGHRLGMGGGYYDRTFEFLLKGSHAKPILIGLGYDNQRVESLSYDSWDVSLFGILTQSKLNIINKK